MVRSAMAPLTIAYYSFDDPAYACARLRVFEPARALGKAVRLIPCAIPQGPGHAVVTDMLPQADLVLMQRYFPCPQTAQVLETIFASGKPVLYDTDDDFAAIGPDHPFHDRIAHILPHIRRTLRQATLVTTSTPVLAAALSQDASRIVTLPNLLPEALWASAPPPSRPVVAVGLAATATHRTDFAPLEPALSQLAQRLAGKARFAFYGCPPTPGMFPEASLIPFAPDYPTYAGKLPRLGWGIGLAPLADTAFNRAKSPIKWMEYAMSGICGIFADLPPYQGVVVHEETGLLVGPEPQAWTDALSRLAGDPALRRRLAVQAHEALLASHTLSAGARHYLGAWTMAAQGGPAHDAVLA